jgi:hypothetical protein
VTGTCARGSYSAASALACSSCAAGRYTSLTTQSACTSCAVGSVRQG